MTPEVLALINDLRKIIEDDKKAQLRPLTNGEMGFPFGELKIFSAGKNVGRTKK